MPEGDKSGRMRSTDATAIIEEDVGTGRLSRGKTARGVINASANDLE
jgi:hypothetical protein